MFNKVLLLLFHKSAFGAILHIEHKHLSWSVEHTFSKLFLNVPCFLCSAGLCWSELGRVCRIRKHHTSMFAWGIRHKKHQTGQLNTEGRATKTKSNIQLMGFYYALFLVVYWHFQHFANILFKRIYGKYSLLSEQMRAKIFAHGANNNLALLRALTNMTPVRLWKALPEETWLWLYIYRVEFWMELIHSHVPS